MLLNICNSGLSSAGAKLAIANAPAHLKCPLTDTLLSDAVSLPCCFKVCYIFDVFVLVWVCLSSVIPPIHYSILY